jgi:hypothetical protein
MTSLIRLALLDTTRPQRGSAKRSPRKKTKARA